MRVIAVVLVLLAGWSSRAASPPRGATLHAQASRTEVVRFEVTGMACQSCASGLEVGIRKLEGVTKADVHLPSKSLTVKFNRAKTDPARIKAEVERLGFEARLLPAEVVRGSPG